jgi:energy-coupling factor transporter ATP-binding protein EcfA2
MIIRRIKLENFKNFIEKEVRLEKTVFIRGKNGSGKSTLALESILFALYGYTAKEALKDLPTRNVANSCLVEVEIEHQNSTFVIIRKYPTKLEVIRDNKEVPFVNAIEAQEYINKTFGDRTHFMKFRIVDAYTKETNFLEEGQTTLKKILFSVSEDLINKMRDKLQVIKRDREQYNKDKAIVYKCYPSMKRLNVICEAIKKLELQKIEVQTDLRELDTELRNLERSIGQAEETKKTGNVQKTKLTEKKTCYVCGQTISESNQKQLLMETDNKIINATKLLEEKTQDKQITQEIVQGNRQVLETIEPQFVWLNELKMKLQARLKLLEYKYTDKDVLVAKTAIEELDHLSTYYLTESVKILEPIINDVLVKIGFKVQFLINDKDKFSIVLQREGIEYKYKDLSTGQKLILQIAFKLALLLEKGESGIVIADEGMSSLDKENLLHILNIFDNLPFQLFFVIHNVDEVPDTIQIIDLK